MKTFVFLAKSSTIVIKEVLFGLVLSLLLSVSLGLSNGEAALKGLMVNITRPPEL